MYTSAAYFEPVSIMKGNPLAYKINLLPVASSYVGGVGILEVYVGT